MKLRAPAGDEAAVLGDICYRAFAAISQAHGFAPDFPAPEAAVGMMGGLLQSPRFFGVAAEIDGRVVGSNFLDERGTVSGVGPITIDPELQNRGVGRALMQAVIARSDAQGFPGIRLLQAGYHMRSLSLYLSLGFEVREHIACVQGPPLAQTIGGAHVRPAVPEDLAAANAVCFRVHGHDRSGELADAIAAGTARVVERGGRITGYASALAFFGHAVGETDDDLKALIGAAEAFGGSGILVPSRNGEVLRWCLANGLRITQSLTLMTRGLYGEPQGAWMPSVLY
jgi:GNAT superfamily N-acetyltransferase